MPPQKAPDPPEWREHGVVPLSKAINDGAPNARAHADDSNLPRSAWPTWYYCTACQRAFNSRGIRQHVHLSLIHI